MYRLIAKIFGLEAAFSYTLFKFRILNRIPFARPLIKFFHKSDSSLATELFGIRFENPVGLGAGLDKNGLLYDIFAAFGYSYIEVGPLDADITRSALKNIQANKPDTILSGCIEKDHVLSFSLAYDFMDMFVLSIKDSDIMEVLEQILDTRLTYDSYKPVLLRITHDIPDLEQVMDFCLLNGVDGFVVATPQRVRQVREMCRSRVPVIGYGGIRSVDQAKEMLSAGASMIEITTGLVLDGPSLAGRIIKNLKK